MRNWRACKPGLQLSKQALQTPTCQWLGKAHHVWLHPVVFVPPQLASATQPHLQGGQAGRKVQKQPRRAATQGVVCRFLLQQPAASGQPAWQLRAPNSHGRPPPSPTLHFVKHQLAETSRERGCLRNLHPTLCFRKPTCTSSNTSSASASSHSLRSPSRNALLAAGRAGWAGRAQG